MPRVLTLYLIRHAIAADAGTAYRTDADRPLTGEGIERWVREARGLGALGTAVDHVLTSPYLRTRQTAELLASGLSPAPEVSHSIGLRPGGRFDEVLADVRAVVHAGAAAVALVGHEPSIGSMTARLIDARHAMPFKKGAVCRIDFDGAIRPGEGRLAWFLPPRALRALGA